jgi:Fe-S cluster assembly iron-binding protein IscA
MRRVIFVLIFLGVLADLFAGEVPDVLIHQGYLTDRSGKAVNGSVNMSFGIYESESGGTALIEEDIGSVSVKDGYYVVEIGKKADIKSVFSAGKKDMYLEIRINGEAGSKRLRIGAVPYAYAAYDVVGDIHPRSVWINGSKVIDESGNMVGGRVDWSNISGIPSGFADGRDNDTLGEMSCNGNQIVRYDGSKWVCSTDNNSGGTVTVVNTGLGLTGGPITTSGTISLGSNYVDGSAYDSRFVNEGQINSITSEMITDVTITNSDLSTGSYTNITGVGILSRLNVNGDTYLEGGNFGVRGGILTSGDITMTVAADVTKFMTSGPIEINEGDYVIPESTTDQGRVVVKVESLQLYTVSPAYTKSVSGEKFTVHRPIANFKDNNGNSVFYIQGATGKVGVGTIAPNSMFEVREAYPGSDNTTYKVAEFNVMDKTGTAPRGIVLYGTTGGSPVAIGKNTSSDLQIWDSNNQPIMTIKDNGNVGIGTTNPSSQLYVSGRIRGLYDMIPHYSFKP